jgi:transposase
MNKKYAAFAGKKGGMPDLPKPAKFKELYVTDIPQDKKYAIIDGKTALVNGDPGMRDMAYWYSQYTLVPSQIVNGKTIEAQTIDATSRYTSATRSVGIRTKRYAKIRKKKKKESPLIDEKTIEKWEADMSKYNSKTLVLTTFVVHLTAKNTLNQRLSLFYGRKLFRKLRFGSFIGNQITEARMVRKLKEVHLPKVNGKLVGPTKLIACIGNWSNTNRKFHPPTKGIGNRRAMRKLDVDVYLTDERNTSCRCSNCANNGIVAEGEGRCVKFRYVKNPRYNPRNPRSRKLVLCHGLVRCVTCGMLWNRDANAAINMLRIATAAIHGERRPLYLSDKWTDNSTPPAPPPRQIQGQIAGLV